MESKNRTGIKETSEMLRFGLGFVTAILKTAADGKLTLSDTLHFKQCIFAVGDAMGNAKMIPAELRDLDEQEAEELKRIAREEFLIEAEKIDFIVKAVLQWIIDLVKLTSAFKQIEK